MQTANKNDYRQRGLATIDRLAKSMGLNSLSFAEWLPSITPHWTWNWPHQIAIYEALQRVTDGTCKRLMIFLPPRHTKTETVTVRYGAYRLERDPKLAIILGSYNQNLANRFSRKTKRITQSRIALASDRKAVEEWETALGGGLRAVGVGGGVTGFGADLILLDDPVKSREEAESETYRNKVWEWFNDDLYTRLHPNAAIVLTMTRWHHDDLAGRLLKEMEDGGEEWEVVNLPAIAEASDPIGRAVGEALCPERYDVAALQRIRRKLGEYAFSALYQQQPTPREGSLFKRSWFKVIDSAPPNLRWKRGYDLAVETKSSNDFTASFRCAFDEAGNLYIADGFHARIEAPKQKKYMLERMQAERNTEHLISKTLHGSSFVQELRLLPVVRATAFKGINEKGDKYTRALSWANRAEEGRLFLVRGGWNDEFIAECIKFTGKGKEHDDQVDAVSIAVQALSRKSGKLQAW
jgi:predicted phage terminase large subunit-like protein